MNSFGNGKNLTRHLRTRQIHWDYPPRHTHTHTIQDFLIIFMPSLPIVQCPFICWSHPAVILCYRSTHARRHCLSDTDSHAVSPSFYYSLNNELHLSPACPSKTQWSYGRLTRTRQAYNLYWLSSRILKNVELDISNTLLSVSIMRAYYLTSICLFLRLFVETRGGSFHLQ